jgi:hypothetical protein
MRGMERKLLICGLCFLAWAAIMPARAGADMYMEGYAGYVKSATVFQISFSCRGTGPEVEGPKKRLSGPFL